MPSPLAALRQAHHALAQAVAAGQPLTPAQTQALAPIAAAPAFRDLVAYYKGQA